MFMLPRLSVIPHIRTITFKTFYVNMSHLAERTAVPICRRVLLTLVNVTLIALIFVK